MTKSMPETIKVKETMHTYSHSQLLKALYMIDDYLERALIPYVLTKHTAVQVIQGDALSGEYLSLGAWKKDTKSGMRILKLIQDCSHKTTEYIEMIVEDVPVRIYRLRNDKIYRNPDYVIYEAWSFRVPQDKEKYINYLKTHV